MFIISSSSIFPFFYYIIIIYRCCQSLFVKSNIIIPTHEQNYISKANKDLSFLIQTTLCFVDHSNINK